MEAMTCRDLGVPIEEVLELLCGLPFVDDHQFTISGDKPMMDDASAPRGFRDLLQELGIVVKAFDGICHIRHRK